MGSFQKFKLLLKIIKTFYKLGQLRLNTRFCTFHAGLDNNNNNNIINIIRIITRSLVHP